jgi:adenine/guanine phosphoribosyltransferase-like PRPP-binding protein
MVPLQVSRKNLLEIEENEEENESEKSEQPLKYQSNHRILVVDDEPFNLSSMKILL